MNKEHTVWVVIRRNGDGYHTWEPDLIAVYFDQWMARDHARKIENGDYEEVALAPQKIVIDET